MNHTISPKPVRRARRALFLGCAVLAALPALPGGAFAQFHAPFHAGFPATFTGAGFARTSKPLVVDLDNNGSSKEIVIGTSTGRLYVLNSNGTLRAGWPQTMPAEIASSPAAGDLDGDGDLEIVVGCGSPNLPLSNGTGRVTAFRKEGTVLWSFTGLRDVVEGPDGMPDPVFATPAVGHIDDDGIEDVVFTSWDFRVYAVKGTNGTLLPGWPIDVRDTIWASPALADLDGDGAVEIIVAADVHQEPTPFNTPNGGAIWVFRRNGTNFPGFPQFAPSPAHLAPVGIHSSPAVGDIDGDGCLEIVVGTGGAFSEAGKELHAWNHDGTRVTNFPRAMDGHVGVSPVLANLDADAALEIVVSDDDSPPNLYGINGNASQIFKMTPKTWDGQNAAVIGEAVAAQIGLENPVILVTGVGFDVTMISRTGIQLSENGAPFLPVTPTLNTGHPVPGATVADLDGDGGLEVIAASSPLGNNETDLRVYAWSMGLAGSLPWPTFHQNPRRTGLASGPGCALPKPPRQFFTVAPCRVSDSRQAGDLTYGGPALVANELRTITFHGRCGIPSTAKAVSLNVTVSNGAHGGFLQLFPGGDGTPSTSTINWRAGQTKANNAIIPLSFDGRGQMTVQVNMPAGAVHVILDVNGYFR